MPKELKTTRVLKKVFKKTFWKLPEAEQRKILERMTKRLNSLYGIEVEISFYPDPLNYRATGGGRYSAEERKIYLYKASLMTFLHEYAHAIHHQKYRNEYRKPEEFSILWSHKVFKNFLPRLYKKNIKERKFFHSPAPEEIENFQYVL